MIKKLALLTLSLVMLSATAHAVTIRLNAPKIELDLAPGEVYSGEIIAENPTAEEVKTRLYLEDWAYKAGGTGDKDFKPAGTLPASASPWIKFNPTEEVIKPYGRVIVRYTITVPADAKGSHFSVLFFESILGDAVDEEGTNVLVAGRIGALFLIEPKGASNRKGRIESVEVVPPAGNKPLEIRTTFVNDGDTEILVDGNFLITDAAGKVYARGEMASLYTPPGAREKGVAQWVGRLPKGSYDAILTYKIGKGKSLTEEKAFTIE